MTRPILVTGAAGFVGSHLTRRLVDSGATVHALLHPNSDPWRLGRDANRIQIHRADLQEREAVAEVAGRAKAAVVFHLAASTVGRGPSASAEEREELRRTNVDGTRWLVEGVGQVDSFVRLGSLTEYGPREAPWRETENPQPISAYGQAGLAATRWLQAQSGLPGVTLRVSLIYGPWRGPDSVISLAMARFAAGESFVPHAPDSVRDPIHVDDVVDACLAAASAKARGLWNVGTGRGLRVQKMVEVLANAMGVSAAAEPDSPGAGNSLLGEVSAIRHALGWTAKITFEHGVPATLAAKGPT